MVVFVYVCICVCVCCLNGFVCFVCDSRCDVVWPDVCGVGGLFMRLCVCACLHVVLLACLMCLRGLIANYCVVLYELVCLFFFCLFTVCLCACLWLISCRVRCIV